MTIAQNTGTIRSFHNIWLFTQLDGSQSIQAKKYDYRLLNENKSQQVIWQGLASSPEEAIAKAKATRGSWSKIIKKVQARGP